MDDTPRFHTMPDGRRVAFRQLEGRGPTLVFLPGYMSDMRGNKATALFEWARESGRACLLFDYSGCGESDGEFEQFTLEDWRDDTLAMIDMLEGPVILIGSSMGGWLALLCAMARQARVTGLVGIAAAPDFTDWGFSADRLALLRRDGVLRDRTVMTEAFWESGQRQRLFLIGPDMPDHYLVVRCPVHLLHGELDDEVPSSMPAQIAGAVRSAEVEITMVKDGDHRLSRPQDIALLLRIVAELAGD